MSAKKWMIVLVAAIAVGLGCTSFWAYAADSKGVDEPLVSMSYITDVLMPRTVNEFEAIAEEKTGEFEIRLSEKLAEALASAEVSDSEDPVDTQAVTDAVLANLPFYIEAYMKENGTSSDAPTSAASNGNYQRLDVDSGKTVICKMGTELIFRLGAANCYAESGPGLVDLTTGSELSVGSAVSRNHLYYVSVDDRGFKTADDTTVFIRGEYTVSD